MSATHNVPQAYPFPDELQPPEIKGDAQKYGKFLAQAIFYNNRHYGPMLFRNNRRLYDLWKAYALGRQDEDKYKPVVGVNPRDATKHFLKGMRWRIKNYATKRINVAVAKMISKEYDVVANPTDPHSISAKREYMGKVKAYAAHKDLLEGLGALVGRDFAPEGVDPNQVPMNDDQFQVHMKLNYKDRAAMLLEKGITSHFEYNETEKFRPQQAFDSVVLGVAVGLEHMGADGRPIMRRVDPAKFVAPANDTPNFADMKYFGFVDEYSIAELKKLDRKNELDEQTVRMIYDRYKIDNQGRYYGTDTLVDYKDVGKVQIMYFEQLTIDTSVWQIRNDDYNNTRVYKMGANFYKGQKGVEEFKQKYGKERSIVKKDLEMVYGGYWVVGSDIVFDYGIREHQAHHKVDGKFGRKFLSAIVFAPNMYQGQVVSVAEQMIPVLDDLQTYNIKIQAIIGASVPKGIQIDLDALRKADLKWDEKNMSDQEKILMYMQTGTIVMSTGDKYGAGVGNKPVQELENGMAKDVTTYIDLIHQGLFELDEIIGINKVTAASNLPERTGKAVAELQMAGTETALDYLYKADEYIQSEFAKRCYPLHIQSLKLNPERYYETLGKENVKWLLKELQGGKRDYGIQVKAKPTQLEWAAFFEDVNMAYQNQQITLSDKVTLQAMDRNLREARAYLKVSEERRRTQAENLEMGKQREMNETQVKVSEMSGQQADKAQQAELGKIKAEGDEAIRLENVKHQNKMREIEKSETLKGANKQSEQEMGMVTEGFKQDITPQPTTPSK